MAAIVSSVLLVQATFCGGSSTGSISVPGLNAGDVLLRFAPGGFEYGFEPVVSLADQIQQNAALDWSSVLITAYFLRGV
ncbi:hypothetical protein [Burkholderia ambifaria]|jgi:hypothetical protein|uniref:hypothetical protein n=1 Tax=Burkholderia ambifaria TaxID=152480 RepID=UPI0011B1D4ED|nr:hypothetical protein [Burkholderia ambifaria]